MIDAGAAAIIADRHNRKVAAEQRILGLELRLGREAVALVRETAGLSPDDFEAPHDRIQRAIFALDDSSGPVSAIAVSLKLGGDPGLQQLGGREYLADIAYASRTTTGTNDLQRQIAAAALDWQDATKHAVMVRRLDDIRDRLHGGHRIESAELARIATDVARFESAAHIVAMPYSLPDPASIPLRQWLYGRHAMRGYVSATVAPGGLGKTSLLLPDGLSIATGRDLLCKGVRPQQCPVWYLGLEDDDNEYARRVAAVSLLHKIRSEEIDGRFFLNSDRTGRFIVAIEGPDGLTFNGPVLSAITREMREKSIGYLIVDPFIASHRVSESNNVMVAAIIREWSALADETHCAIELSHHTRKGSGQSEPSADDARGASALVWGTRSTRVMIRMNADQQAKAGVDNPRRFFRVVTDKANMALHSPDGDWFELVDIELPNGGPGVPGDRVQAVARWRMPDPSDIMTDADVEAIKAKIASGFWPADSRAKNWAGNTIADVLSVDIKDPGGRKEMATALASLIRKGVLRVVKKTNPQRKPQDVVEVVGPIAPKNSSADDDFR